MTLLRPHPALKAISEQASPADQWMNDDDHRYGALRESYAFEYAVYEQADKNANTHFNFETYDTYCVVSRARARSSNINAKYLHGSIPYWNSIVEHPDYDAFWKDEAWVTQMQGRVRAEPERRRLLGSGGSVGAVGDLPPLGAERSERQQLHGRRSVVPRAVAQSAGRVDRPDLVRRPRHGGGVPREDRGAVVPLLAARHGREISVEGVDVPDRLEQLADLCGVAAAGRPPPACICAPTARSRSMRRPPADRYVQYVSDPANPVPYRQRPISPTYPAGDWRRWEVADQRFVDHRPDVATWISAPLDRDLTVTGELAADAVRLNVRHRTATSSSS